MNSLIRLQRYSFAVRTYNNFYNGQFVPSSASQFYEVYNPVTQEHIARSPQSTVEEFNAIVASAKEAFPAWSKVPLLCNAFLMQPVKGTCSNL